MKTGHIIALVIASIGWITICIRLVLRLMTPDIPVHESFLQFFSYFTILTNLLVTIYFSAILWSTQRNKPSKWTQPGNLTALMIFISIVGIVYHIALKPLWQPEGLQMILSETHHTFIPLATIIFWWIHERTRTYQLRTLLLWLMYPVLYFAYVLIRGNVSGFYPYPFLNVDALGIKSVLTNACVLLTIMFVLMMIIYFTTKRFARNSSQ